MSEAISQNQNFELMDQEWFGRIQEARRGGIATYRALRLSKDELTERRAVFVASEYSKNPDLTPFEVDDEVIDLREQRLVELKQDLLERENDPTIKRAYRWRLNELIATTRMVRAAKTGNMRAFEAYNKFVYGEPDQEVFAATNNYYRDMALKALEDDDPAVVEAAQELLVTLPVLDSSRSIIPEDDVFDTVKDLHKEFFERLLDGVELPSEGFANARSADAQTMQIMQNAGIGHYELADQDDGVGTWDVANSRERIRRPITDVHIPLERYIGLVAGHEVGTHGSEYQNGLRSGYGIVAIGLDRGAGAGEGKATIREQIPYDQPSGLAEHVRFQDIFRRHYSISLAYGHGGEQMDFVGVYERMHAIDKLWERKHRDDATVQEADARAHDRTWTLLAQRTLKGAEGAGHAYFKDKIYAESNLAHWVLAHEHPELLQYWESGLIDLTNPRHVQLLLDLGIIPEHQ